MTVYVDQAKVMFKGKPRHHLTADTLDELHAFTAQVGIHRCWFHRHPRHPHYDVTDPQRAAAIAAGALAVDSRELLARARLLAPSLKPRTRPLHAQVPASSVVA